MQNLKVNQFNLITESVLRALNHNRITTILDFLQEDVTKLTAITKLKLPEILSLRNDIFVKYSAPIQNGTILLEKKKKILSTGWASLDKMLDGGLPIGYITELCGLAESGKTQLCLHLSINCVKRNQNTVLYIDTKGDFSAVRIQKILEESGISHKEMAQIMYQIRVVRVWTLDETVELLQSLKNKWIEIKNLALIILDSLPCLMFQFLGDDNKIGLYMLNTLVNYSRYLCRELEICMICTNIQTRWVDQDVADIEDDADISTVMKDAYVEKRNRCLGKYWQDIPKLILILEKSQSKENTDEKILISVMKSNKLKVEPEKVLYDTHNSGLGVIAV